jgi:hypothetical protein
MGIVSRLRHIRSFFCWQPALFYSITLTANLPAIRREMCINGVVGVALRAMRLACRRPGLARTTGVTSSLVLERRDGGEMRGVAASAVRAARAERAGLRVAGVVDIESLRNRPDGQLVGDTLGGRPERGGPTGVDSETDGCVAAGHDVSQPRPTFVGGATIDLRPEPLGEGRPQRLDHDGAQRSPLARGATRCSVRVEDADLAAAIPPPDVPVELADRLLDPAVAADLGCAVAVACGLRFRWLCSPFNAGDLGETGLAPRAVQLAVRAVHERVTGLYVTAARANQGVHRSLFYHDALWGNTECPI